MAADYSANQYDSAFISTKLQNWSVPKPSTERPSAHDGFTQFISNDRGHLLPGVPRSKTSPWGTFIGTWDMPSKIPPAKVSLTSRSADASQRLTEWIKKSESLVTACNGLRPEITGKVSLNKEEDDPPQQQSRSPSQKSDCIPCSPQKDEPEGPTIQPGSRSRGCSSHDEAQKDHETGSGRRTSHHEDLVVEM
ncbi:protein Flattop [Eleutherodactylus coqui]|uniref:protein Flattop n=1 Tax=Eleutherodactylus coqui TaxID=57060 RepID=UPI0034627F6C